jgi:hypothetical protein
LPTDYVIAASDSSVSDKALADEVCGATNAGEVITAALAAHAAVYLMDGTYVSTVRNNAIVNVTSAGRSLRGASKAGTVIRMADGQAESAYGIFARADDLTVSDLTLDGNKANQLVTSCYPHGPCGEYFGVRAHMTSGHRFSNMIVKDFCQDAFFFSNSSDIVISGCETYNAGFCGIEFWQSTDSVVENCDSHNNCWGVMAGGVVDGVNCSNIIIRDSKLHNNGPEHGAYLQGSGLQVLRNQVYDNAVHGIRVSAATDFLIDGNECWGNRNNIEVCSYEWSGPCTNIRITNNICRNGGWTNCDLFDDVSGCLVEGNTFDGCLPTYGSLWIAAEFSDVTPPMNNIIRNNKFLNSHYGVVEGYSTYPSPDYNSYLFNTFTNVDIPYTLRGTHDIVVDAPPPDVNGDGSVNVLDMVRVGQHWGGTGAVGWIPEDINMDGAVDVLDATLVGQGWTG